MTLPDKALEPTAVLSSRSFGAKADGVGSFRLRFAPAWLNFWS
jgi:hypothetical protein